MAIQAFRPRLVVNLGGEGERPAAINVQGSWALDPQWRSSRDGKTLAQLQAEGHIFVIADNLRLPFANNAIERVVTASVPIDRDTFLGPGVCSQEVDRILEPSADWIHDGVCRKRQASTTKS